MVCRNPNANNRLLVDCSQATNRHNKFPVIRSICVVPLQFFFCPFSCPKNGLCNRLFIPFLFYRKHFLAENRHFILNILFSVGNITDASDDSHIFSETFCSWILCSKLTFSLKCFKFFKTNFYRKLKYNI